MSDAEMGQDVHAPPVAQLVICRVVVMNISDVVKLGFFALSIRLSVLRWFFFGSLIN